MFLSFADKKDNDNKSKNKNNKATLTRKNNNNTNLAAQQTVTCVDRISAY